jgi:hypothetical protein
MFKIIKIMKSVDKHTISDYPLIEIKHIEGIKKYFLK